MATLEFGTTLTWDGAAVAALTSIGGVKAAVDEKDVTTHDSSDYYKEFLPGLIDPGTITLEGYMDQTDTTGQVAMVTDFNARSSKTFTVTFPSATGATWTGTAWIKDIEIGGGGLDGMIPFKATLRITGKPTFAVSTATGPSALVITGNVSGALTPVPAYAVGVFDYVVDCSAEASITLTVTAAGADSIRYSTDGGSTWYALTTTVAGAAISTTADEIVTILLEVLEDDKATISYTIRAYEDA
jgi:hypothetical protein